MKAWDAMPGATGIESLFSGFLQSPIATQRENIYDITGPSFQTLPVSLENKWVLLYNYVDPKSEKSSYYYVSQGSGCECIRRCIDYSWLFSP